jgi:PTS system nitrogen regulatory IIA component
MPETAQRFGLTFPPGFDTVMSIGDEERSSQDYSATYRGNEFVKLAALLDEQNIRIHLDARDMESAIRMLVDSFRDRLAGLDPDRVCERLLEAESNLPVPLGHDVRIPHARIGGIDQILMAVGTSAEGIPLVSDQNLRVHLVFVIITPKTQAAVMLQTLSAIARLVQNNENRKALVSTTSPARFLRILEESGIEVKKAIIAADLMCAAPALLTPEMTLNQAVDALGNSREEGLPVVESGTGEIVGELSARKILEIGLPKYMKLISDPTVLSDFEPFEAYYRKEDDLTVRDVLFSDVLRLAPETPVEIVAHEMLSHRCGRAYVVRDRKLLGVVYRKDIIRKVLML